MRTQVSVVALVAALLASSPATAQISLGGDGLGVSVGGDNGVNVDVGGGSDGLNVDAGVGGSDGLNVGAGVSAEDGLDVDAGVGLGGTDGINVDAGVGAGGSDDLVDVDVDAGVGGSGGVGPNGGQLIDLGSPDELVDVEVGGEQGVTSARISALDETARLEALIGRIGDPQLADVDIDAVVDDQRVGIVALADLVDGDSLADVEAAIETNPEGRSELLDALGASNVLSSILGREGIDLEDVLSVSIDGDGAAEIVVLGGGENDATGEGGGVLGQNGLLGLTDAELAELDVDLLSDEELAEVDLALLPEEEQRVDAVLRLLSRSGPEQGDAEGTTRIVDLGVLLGADSLAVVDDAIGDAVPEVDADLAARLGVLGIDPEAVVAIGTDAGGNERVFIDTSLLLGGDGGSGDGSGGSGDTGGDSGGTGGGTGNTGGGRDGAGGGGSGGTGGGTDTDTDVGNGSDAGTSGTTGGNGAGAGAAGGVDVNGAGAAGDAGLELVATLDCDVGGATLSQGTSASPTAIAQATSLELVRVVGCEQTLASDDVERVRDALESNAAITEAIDSVGLSLEQVIGATVTGEVVTVFVEQPVA